MAEILPKTEKTSKKIKIAVKRDKNAIFRYFSNRSNFDLNSKFQETLMFNG